MSARARLPLIAGVLAVHLAAFWWLADKHFLPKVPHTAPRTPANFAGRERTRAVDPVTGEKVTETDFVVSTRLAPSPSPAEIR